MDRISIFDIERRIDPIKEYFRIYTYMSRTGIAMSNEYKSLFSWVDDCFIDWKYRNRALSISDYLSDLGIDLKKPKSDIEALYGIELLYNLVIWIPEYALKQLFVYDDQYEELMKVCAYVRENVKSTLEGLNMKAEKISCNRFIFCKRDADVDSVLENAPELAENLLGYLDFRRKNDIEFKRIVLRSLADYLEGKRDSLNKLGYKSICDSVFFAYNSFNIRHNNEKQVTFQSEKELIQMYDKVFKASLHLIRSNEVAVIKNDINQYKPH